MTADFEREILEIDFAQPQGFRPLSLDLRTPEAAGAPLVVFLHGGGWLRGSRKVFTPGISDAQSFDRIVAAGFAVASCEYRLSGEARFPAQLDDVDAALAWLHAHGAEHGVDASRIVLWGVSAGATLAALTGLRRDDIRGVVDWFGPADMFAMAEHDMGEPAGRDARSALARRARRRPARSRAGGEPGATRCTPVRRRSTSRTAPQTSTCRSGRARRWPRPCAESARTSNSTPCPAGRHFWQGLDDTAPVFDRAIDFVSRVTAD